MSCSTCFKVFALKNHIMAFKCGHQFHEHCLQNNWTCPKCKPVKIENRLHKNISTVSTNRKSAGSSEPRTKEQLSHYSTGFPPGRYRKRVEVAEVAEVAEVGNNRSCYASGFPPGRYGNRTGCIIL